MITTVGKLTPQERAQRTYEIKRKGATRRNAPGWIVIDVATGGLMDCDGNEFNSQNPTDWLWSRKSDAAVAVREWNNCSE